METLSIMKVFNEIFQILVSDFSFEFGVEGALDFGDCYGRGRTHLKVKSHKLRKALGDLFGLEILSGAYFINQIQVGWMTLSSFPSFNVIFKFNKCKKFKNCYLKFFFACKNNLVNLYKIKVSQGRIKDFLVGGFSKILQTFCRSFFKSTKYIIWANHYKDLLLTQFFAPQANFWKKNSQKGVLGPFRKIFFLACASSKLAPKAPLENFRVSQPKKWISQNSTKGTLSVGRWSNPRGGGGGGE